MEDPARWKVMLKRLPMGIEKLRYWCTLRVKKWHQEVHIKHQYVTSWEWESVEPLLFVRVTQILLLDHFPKCEIQELTGHLLPMLMGNFHRGKKMYLGFCKNKITAADMCNAFLWKVYTTGLKIVTMLTLKDSFLFFVKKVLACTLLKRSLTRCVSFKIIVLLDITFSQKLTQIVTWEFIHDNMPTNNSDEGLVVSVGKKICKMWMKFGETVWHVFNFYLIFFWLPLATACSSCCSFQIPCNFTGFIAVRL